METSVAILYCIEISAPNLEYFGHLGHRLELHINYAPPRLLDVRIGGHSSVPLSSALCPLITQKSQNFKL
uniref:Uncharacterized protein n=1 Tax=Quercus lobata TaxID=97700 RepID=A0A7N2MPL8_QUELO